MLKEKSGTFLRGQSGKSRDQMLKKKNRRSPLTGRECLKGMWKAFTMGMRWDHSRNMGYSQSERLAMEDCKKANGKSCEWRE